MNKALIIIIFEMLIILFIVSQILIPCFSNMEFFWLFKKTKEPVSPSGINEISELDKKVTKSTEEFKESVEQIQQVKNQINQIESKTKLS